MIRFLRHKAEMACPWGRMFAMALAVMISLWTAGAVALSPPPGTPIINTATATYRDVNGGGDALGNALSSTSNSVSFNLSGAPLLKVTAVAGPNPVAPGQTLTYTITIENTGNITATSVTANALLSAHLQFLGASNGGVSSPPAVNWNLGDILSGGQLDPDRHHDTGGGHAGGHSASFFRQRCFHEWGQRLGIAHNECRLGAEPGHCGYGFGHQHNAGRRY